MWCLHTLPSGTHLRVPLLDSNYAPGSAFSSSWSFSDQLNVKFYGYDKDKLNYSLGSHNEIETLMCF